MLNYHYAFAATWILVLVLYFMGWSTYYVDLQPMLFAFFIFVILTSIIFGSYIGKASDPEEVDVSPRGCACVTVGIIIFALLDFAYQGGIPLFSSSEYVGYDIRYKLSGTIGIPVVHVILVSFTLFFSFFMAYCVVYSKRNRKKFLPCFFVTVIFMLLMGSRSYVLFTIIALILLIVNKAQKPISKIPIRNIIILLIVLITVLFLFGIAGNIRSGFAWNDCSYIMDLNKLDNYPTELPKEFSWAYTYASNTLANLNLNILNENHGFNIQSLIANVLPTTITKNWGIPIDYTWMYWDHHLNASTGFSGVYGAAGFVGLFFFFVFQISYFFFFDSIYKTSDFGQSLGRMILCLFAILSCFYDPYTNVALCVAPWYLAGYIFIRNSKKKRELLNLGYIDRGSKC